LGNLAFDLIQQIVPPKEHILSFPGDWVAADVRAAVELSGRFWPILQAGVNGTKVYT